MSIYIIDSVNGSCVALFVRLILSWKCYHDVWKHNFIHALSLSISLSISLCLSVSLSISLPPPSLPTCRHLPAALDEFDPDIVVYNAGTDVLEGDPLGNMDITPEVKRGTL